MTRSGTAYGSCASSPTFRTSTLHFGARVASQASTASSRFPVELAPSQWGSLRVIEAIGHGAFGDVYRAFDLRLDREVALKLIRRDDADHDARGAAVIEEGRLQARVRHPGVVTIYGADRIDDRAGLWMELIEGGHARSGAARDDRKH